MELIVHWYVQLHSSVMHLVLQTLTTLLFVQNVDKPTLILLPRIKIPVIANRLMMKEPRAQHIPQQPAQKDCWQMEEGLLMPVQRMLLQPIHLVQLLVQHNVL